MNTTFWERIQQGDEGTFRQLYDEYSDLFYGYGMKIAGDDNLVTESIQLLFVYLYEKRQSCLGSQPIPAYLCVALKRMLLNELKKTANGALTSLGEVNPSECRFGLEINIETAIVRFEPEREQLEVLQKRINGLTKQQREVLYLKYYEKLDSDEIAEVTGLTPRTVYNTTHMVISRLRERLSKSFLLTVAVNLWIFNWGEDIENRKELLEQYMKDGRLSLKGRLSARKSVLGGELEEFREEKRADALTSRSNAVGRRKLVVLKSNYIYWRVAALFILLFGIGGYYYLSEEKATSEAVIVNYKPPDGSSVKLMRNSTLSYSKMSWLWGRKLSLFRSASFDVTPGKTLIVRTEAGDVTVLGTRSLVEQEGKTITVNCEEGAVKVEIPIGEQILNAGESVRCDKNKIGPAQEKEELPEVLGYEDDPLVNVVADTQHIFDVEVVGCEKYNGLYYNGTVLARDLYGTLKKASGSLGINYQLNGQKVISGQTGTEVHVVKRRNYL